MRQNIKVALAMIEAAIVEAGQSPLTSGHRIWHPFRTERDYRLSLREDTFQARLAALPPKSQEAIQTALGR